jgi:hypothetical protein
MPSLAICGMSYVSVSIKLDDENYIEKMENCMNDCFDILLNDNDKNSAVVMYYDFEKAESTFGIVNTRGLCKWLFGILKETKEYYDANLECQIEMEVFGSKTHSIINLLTFAHKGVFTDSELVKYRFATKDRDTLLTIKGLLRMCEDKKDLDKLLEQIENEDDMWDCFKHVYMKNFDKSRKIEMIKKEKIPREKIPREKIPREEIPREEIPREKTLSKKEKEKLKKQKAKEANKLRDQEKKDKAKLAEQQAKQFEKQQKERERKRIETARKKKLALLKK